MHINTFAGHGINGILCYLVMSHDSVWTTQCMGCYHRRGECDCDACILKRDCFGGPSVMVWGAISFHGRSELICVQDTLTGRKYCDEILAPDVVRGF